VIVNIIRVIGSNKIALAKKASGTSTPLVFYVFWNKHGFLPKEGHSYKIRPCHEWVESELVHGEIYDFVSMEDALSASYSKKGK
jgi:hypothetical protein